jgi:hypothetical protein
MKRSLKTVMGGLVAALVAVGVAAAASTPSVVTGPATKATNTTVHLAGTVNPDASSSTYSFQWGLTNQYGSGSPTHSAGSGTKAVSVATTPGSLIPGTRYHYRLIASNRFGLSLGIDHTFKTTGHPPAVVLTGPTSELPTTSSATMTGGIDPNGESTRYYFEWGTTTAPYPYSTPNPSAVLTPSTSVLPITATLTGLAPGVTFHYQLVAVHESGPMTFGGDRTFTTLPSPRPVPAISVRTTPSRTQHKPYLFSTTGKLTPAASLPSSVACGSGGTVAVRYFIGRHSYALRTANLKSDCTFFAQTLFHRLIGKGNHSTRLRIEVRFRGNPYVGSSTTQVQRVHLG